MIGTTLGLIALGTSIAGTTLSAVGSVKSGNAAKRAGESMAQREEYNAAIADLQADDALARGDEEASRFATQVRSLIGTQRAGFAAQNVVVGEGSARDVQQDTAYRGELDRQEILANAKREAWGFRVEAEDRRKGAEVARAGGNAAASAGRWGAAATALGGAGSLALSAYGWQRGR
jgi:hypothetical protein